MKDLAVIIVNFNGRDILDACLASIQKNTRKIDFEVIVIDNGSSDGAPGMVMKKYPRVKLVENRENLGFVKGCNAGLKLANARYSILLNNDTEVKGSALDKMVEFMDSHPEAGACGAKLLNIDGSIQRQGGILGNKFWLSRGPVSVDFVIGAALLARREAIEQVGLMDENLFFYNDDLDWCMCIRKAGWKIYFLPQAEIVHHGGYSSKRTFNRRIFVEGFKGGLYFCRKHYGEAAYHIYRLFLAFSLLFALVLFVFNREKRKAYLEIILAALRGQIPEPVVK